MLRIDRNQKRFTRLEQPSCAAASITERYDLEELIFNSFEHFFAEIGQKLFVIGKEVQPSEFVQDRIDLLALDEDGRAVVIELKRGNDRLQLLQAIAYAGMVSKWKPEDFLGLLDAARRDQLLNFLSVSPDEINREQRIILIAEAYDYEVLAGAEWLHDSFQVDILCGRVTLAADSSLGAEYLSCTHVFPAPELAHQAVPRRGTTASAVPWKDWESALASISNPAVVEYFKSQLQAGRRSNLADRVLFYEAANKRRWNLHARGKWAYCWQEPRFEGDLSYWKQRLSKPTDVTPVKEGRALSFNLFTAQDFATFGQAVNQDLSAVEWRESVPEDDSAN